VTDTTEGDRWPASGWFDGAYDAVVPIEMVLPSGRGLTLRLDPQAHLDDDDSRHVLGRNRQILLFETLEELAAYVADDEEHTLRDRPVWPLVRELSVEELTVSAIDRHDLMAIGELFAGAARDELGASLGDTLDLVADIAEQCALAEVEEILDPDSAFWQCAGSPAALADVLRDPDRRGALNEQWQRILTALDRTAVWPLVAVPWRAAVGASAGEQQLLEDLAPVETLWIGMGSHGSGYTLRERTPTVTDPDARWLMQAHRLQLAESVERLAAWVAVGPEVDLATVDGWEDVVSRSVAASVDHQPVDYQPVDYQPYEDNVVDLAEALDRIGPGLDADSAGMVVERYWFLFGLAHVLGYPELIALLDEGEPIGRFVSGTATDIANLHWDAALRLASENFDAVREEWNHALAFLAARCDWVGGGAAEPTGSGRAGTPWDAAD
jgi:hypothetical protein